MPKQSKSSACSALSRASVSATVRSGGLTLVFGVAGLGPHAGVDAGVVQCAVAGDPLVGHGQVVGHHLGGDTDAASPGIGDQFDAAAGGDVADVEPAAGEFRQHQVAADDDFLGGGRNPGDTEASRDFAFVHCAVGEGLVLAVDDDRAVEPSRRFQRLAHDLAVGGGVAVVGPADRPGLDHGVEIDRFVAGPTHRNGRDRVDADAAVVLARGRRGRR